MMTANRGHILSTADEDILGVHSLDSFSFTVPDLATAESFHKAFGLDVETSGNALLLRTFGSDHVWTRIFEAETKALNYLSFGVFDQDLDRFHQRLGQMGVKRLDPPKGVESNGFWFRDPDGTYLELKVAPKSSPDRKNHGTHPSSPEGIMGAPTNSKRVDTKPTRMAHILVFTRNVQKAVDFYSSVLGLALSDRCGDLIAFMHGRHGSDHHMIAFVKSDGPGIHHTSWDVGTINEIGVGAMQMADKGYSKGWGLGRHVLGSNLFHYVGDPWGSYAEYSCDIDFIPKQMTWEAGDYAPEDAFYIWGPTPPEDWDINHEWEARKAR